MKSNNNIPTEYRMLNAEYRTPNGEYRMLRFIKLYLRAFLPNPKNQRAVSPVQADLATNPNLSKLVPTCRNKKHSIKKTHPSAFGQFANRFLKLKSFIRPSKNQRAVSPVQAAVAPRQAASEPQAPRRSNTAKPPKNQAKPNSVMAYVAQKIEPVRNTACFSSALIFWSFWIKPKGQMLKISIFPTLLLLLITLTPTKNTNAQHPIVWDNNTNASYSAATQTLSKTDTTSSWNTSGAESRNRLLTNEDGHITYVYNGEDKKKAFGFSDTNTNDHSNTIDHGILLQGDDIYVFEGTTQVGSYGKALEGDTLKIERSASTMYYYKNGTQLTSTTITPSIDLIVDVAFNEVGATFDSMTVNFENYRLSIETVTESGITWDISGAGLSGNYATGSQFWLQPDLPEENAVSTMKVDYKNGAADQGVDIAFEIDHYAQMKNIRLLIPNSEGFDVYRLEDGDYSLDKKFDLAILTNSSGLSTHYNGTNYCSNEDWNYVHSIVYDDATVAVSESKAFMDGLGRTVQTQAKDLEADNVLVSETVYDEFGRPAWQSLQAPKYSSNLCHHDFFAMNNSSDPYSWEDFDEKGVTVNNPSAATSYGVGSLGWYYDNYNQKEAYVPHSDYPFSSVEYYRDPLNRPKRSSGPGEHHRMGANREARVFYQDEAGELAYAYGIDHSHIENLLQKTTARKTVTVDEEGLEFITYTDDGGNLIASCYSGLAMDTNCVKQRVSKTINPYSDRANFVDIHLPEATNDSLILSFLQPPYWGLDTSWTFNGSYTLFDLDAWETLVEGPLSTDDYSVNYTTGAVTFKNGYDTKSLHLRISFDYDANYLAYLEDLFQGQGPPQHRRHQVVKYAFDYSQWTVNYFDDAGRIVKTVPPAGFDCQYDAAADRSDQIIYYEEPTCTTCPGGNTNGTYYFNPQTDFYTYTLPTPGVGEDHFYQLRIDPMHSIIGPDTSYCDFLIEETDQEPQVPSIYTGGIDHTTTLTDIGHMRTQRRVQENVGNELGSARSESSSFDALFHGGGPTGDVNPNPATCTCPPGFDNCYLQSDWSSPADAITAAQSYCREEFGKELGNFEPEDQGNGQGPDDTYCFNCGETIEGLCSNSPFLFFARFKLEVEVYGVAGQSETLIGNNPHYLYATLGYRSCDCSLQWDLNSFSGSYDVLSNADLDPYSALVFKLIDVDVARSAPNNFVNFSAGHWKDEFLQTLRMGITLHRYVYPEYNVTAPQPTMTNTYEYDDLGQLAKSTSPDEGTSGFAYNEKGQLRFSQTADQAANNRFSYNNYDRAGRVVESGEYDETGGNLIFENQLILGTDPNSVDSIINQADGLNDTHSYDVHVFVYDTAETNPAYSGTLSGYNQRYLLGKVSKTTNYDATDHPEGQTTWYSYDRFGRVDWMIHELPELSKFITIDYTFDFNGRLTELAYQQEVTLERFHHHYTYDANGRLLTVKTSTDGLVSTADLQATYYYYDHGPLERVELGDETQGLDYAYTIHGWLKSINHPELDSLRDPGRDGKPGHAHANVAKDIFGLTIDYYNGDYSRDSTDIGAVAAGTNYYNGRIKDFRWQTNTSGITGTYQHTGSQLMYQYQYDELYRMSDATFGTVTETSGNAPTFTSSMDYKVSDITYDQNGNITALTRTAYGTGRNMDAFTYNYTSGKNRLEHVDDNITSGNWTMDIDDQGSTPWYTYNTSGQMTGEGSTSDGNWMSYNYYGLVTDVHKESGKTTSKAHYAYDETGQRLKKIAYDGTGTETASQWYIRGAGGSLLAIYEKPLSGSLSLVEQPIYGTAKLGTHDVASSKVVYELKDHLGNVRAVIDRAKSGGAAQLISFRDFFPFGAEMPGRNNTSTQPYRYRYQGKEYEEEIAQHSFELRNYQQWLGRWQSPDPYHQHHSPYLAMSNNPSSFIDPNGGIDESTEEDELKRKERQARRDASRDAHIRYTMERDGYGSGFSTGFIGSYGAVGADNYLLGTDGYQARVPGLNGQAIGVTYKYGKRDPEAIIDYGEGTFYYWQSWDNSTITPANQRTMPGQIGYVNETGDFVSNTAFVAGTVLSYLADDVAAYVPKYGTKNITAAMQKAESLAFTRFSNGVGVVSNTISLGIVFYNASQGAYSTKYGAEKPLEGFGDVSFSVIGYLGPVGAFASAGYFFILKPTMERYSKQLEDNPAFLESEYLKATSYDVYGPK